MFRFVKRVILHISLVSVIMKVQKTILIIMDGLGEAAEGSGNAVKLAKTPHLDQYKKECSNVLLASSGNAVGLPEGVMGASEPGHLTMGAGRIVWQPLEEINQAIKSGKIFQNQVLLNFFTKTRSKGKPLHLIGMVSDAGVHSHLNHLFALLQMAKHEGVREVYIHAITDGRDVPERSAQEFLAKIQSYTQMLGVGKLVSMVGRYYAMDRDQNYDRMKVAYDLYLQGVGQVAKDYTQALIEAYETIETDYYLTPYQLEGFKKIEPQDGVIFFNFRSDRSRQLTHALVDSNFESFTRPYVLENLVAIGPFTHVAPVAFPPQRVVNNFGEWLSKNKIPQLRIAETEKYAHVTFFFNSQQDEPYPLEERILVNSPKCPSYAEKPEMSAKEVTVKVCAEIEKQKFGAIVLNFANPDLVGHSGNLEAAMHAVETVDRCVGEVVKTALKNHYQVILTADHGNAEQMFYPDSDLICPAHTINPVRCYLIGLEQKKLKEGLGLSSIVPTMFKMMGIEKPSEMTGESLF